MNFKVVGILSTEVDTDKEERGVCIRLHVRTLTYHLRLVQTKREKGGVFRGLTKDMALVQKYY